MRGEPFFSASDKDQLREFCDHWGQSAPDRLSRTGRKSEVENWILARRLEKRMNGGEFTLPLKVWRDENPDFVVQDGSETIGLELTEAVDPEEQVSWTENAKEDRRTGTNTVRWIDPKWSTGQVYSELVRNAVSRKVEKCSTECSDLLVYLNTTDDMFDAPAEREKKLRAALLDQERFGRVWVLSDGQLFCFSRSSKNMPDCFDRLDAKPRGVEF